MVDWGGVEEFPLGFGWGRFVPYKLYLVCREMCANWGVAPPVHFLCKKLNYRTILYGAKVSTSLKNSEDQNDYWCCIFKHVQVSSQVSCKSLSICKKLIPQKDHGFAPELFNMNISWTVKDGLLLSLCTLNWQLVAWLKMSSISVTRWYQCPFFSWGVTHLMTSSRDKEGALRKQDGYSQWHTCLLFYHWKTERYPDSKSNLRWFWVCQPDPNTQSDLVCQQ